MDQWVSGLEKWSALHQPLIGLAALLMAAVGFTLRDFMSAVAKRTWIGILPGTETHQLTVGLRVWIINAPA